MPSSGRSARLRWSTFRYASTGARLSSESSEWRCRSRIMPLGRLVAQRRKVEQAIGQPKACAQGMLRFVAIEPRKQHDVGPLLLQYRDRLPPSLGAGAERLAEISHRLRKEREFAFYGDEDFIPTDEYTREQAAEAVEDARWVVGLLDPFPARDPQA